MPPELTPTPTPTVAPDIAPQGSSLYDQLMADVLSILAILASTGLAFLSFYLKQKLSSIEEFVHNVSHKGQLPEEETERVNQILAQLAVIYEADRVTLGVFHNGVIGSQGAHYNKVEITAGYSAPGVIKLPELGKDVEASTIMDDFGTMWKEGKELFLDKSSAHHSCALYMTRRDIFHLWNKVLFVGNLDVGILSMHWCAPLEKLPVPPETSRGERLAKELIGELTSIIYSAKERKRILG